MTIERYNELISMRTSGELNKPENLKMFNELQDFERQARENIEQMALETTDNAKEARAYLETLTPKQQINLVLEGKTLNVDKDKKKAVKLILKEEGI